MKTFLFLAFTSLFFLAPAQESLQFFQEVAAEGQIFTTDRLGNFYVANGPILKRFTQNGRPERDFRAISPGNISRVDASNPMHILVFYRDFNQAVFLDRNLTQKSRPLSFTEIGIENAELVCSSSKGGIWVLNWLKRELVYIDNEMRIAFRKSLPVGVIPASQPPGFMTEDENHLYISFQGAGILQFDLMGNYRGLHPVDAALDFQVSRNDFLFVQLNKVNIYSPARHTRTVETGINMQILSVRREGNNFFVFTGEEVVIFNAIYIIVGQLNS